MSLQDVTYGVSTTGNMKALCMSISSILLGTHLPCAIISRSEGEYPAFSEFYLEQLADLARIKGVSFNITVEPSRGIRYARDWLIASCLTKYLHMGDDDVIYETNNLCRLHLAATGKEDKTLSFIQGTKADVNNRRGYNDFSKKIFTDADATDGAGYNFIWEGFGKVVRSPTCDTGNLLLHLPNIKAAGAKFEHFEHSTNSSGDDTLFALLLRKAGLDGYFATGARAWHLEKPKVTSFNEFAARKNLVYSQALLIGFSPTEASQAVEQMLAWEHLRPKA